MFVVIVMSSSFVSKKCGEFISVDTTILDASSNLVQEKNEKYQKISDRIHKESHEIIKI